MPGGGAAHRLTRRTSESNGGGLWAPGLLGREVLVELVGVLGRVYRLDRDRIAGLVADLLELANLRAADVRDALEPPYQAGEADFAGLMILAAARRAGAELFTLDRKLARQAGAALLEGA